MGQIRDCQGKDMLGDVLTATRGGGRGEKHFQQATARFHTAMPKLKLEDCKGS